MTFHSRLHSLIITIVALVFSSGGTSAWSAGFTAPEELTGGALQGESPRVIISTDIGGSDPDDFQSMVHLLIYADVFQIEGLLSSPPGRGRTKHILEVIAAYEKDYPRLIKRSSSFPTAEMLRKITVQGATESAPEQGFSSPTAGSHWIISRAHAMPKKPLYILVWGSITDVAQAVHDDPSIKKHIRVYSIGSWNTRNDRKARDFLYEHHRDLWWVETDTTFRGMYVGGPQGDDLGNRTFLDRHVKSHGALGDLLVRKKSDIKMGDSPSVLYMLRGNLDDPTAAHWGGSFVRTGHAPAYWTDDPKPERGEKRYPGARTVNRWRTAYLRDWQERMDWALADPAPTKPLTLEWTRNILTIRGDGLPGKKLEILYLEAYCRANSQTTDWVKHTVVGHQTELISKSPDGTSLTLRCTLRDGVIVDHRITAAVDEVDFRLVAHNPGKQRSEAHWAQPCIRVGAFTGLGDPKNPRTYAYLEKSFIFLDGKLSTMPTKDWATEARYVPGQVWAAPGVPRADVNPRPLNPHTPSNGLIGCFSADNTMIMATAWEPYQELFQGVITCLHSDFRLGGLEAGATKKIHGKIYVLKNDIPGLLKRYARDFPASSRGKERQP